MNRSKLAFKADGLACINFKRLHLCVNNCPEVRESQRKFALKSQGKSGNFVRACSWEPWYVWGTKFCVFALLCTYIMHPPFSGRQKSPVTRPAGNQAPWRWRHDQRESVASHFRGPTYIILAGNLKILMGSWPVHNTFVQGPRGSIGMLYTVRKLLEIFNCKMTDVVWKATGKIKQIQATLSDWSRSV